MMDTDETQEQLIPMEEAEIPQEMYPMGEAWEDQELAHIHSAEDDQDIHFPLKEEMLQTGEAEADQETMRLTGDGEPCQEDMIPTREVGEAVEEFLHITETGETCLTEIKTNQLSKPDLTAEPHLIINSPPPNFLSGPGQPCMPWNKWLRSFENYIELMGQNKLTDSTKFVLLRNSLGLEGQRILTMLFPQETSYNDAVSALAVYFSPEEPSQPHLLDFNQRAQMKGESAGQFICALDQLLKPSNYKELYEQLLIKQLVEKTNNPQLRERLLSEPGPFTLARALQISTEVESQTVPEVNVYIDEAEPPVKRKRGRPRKGEVREKLPAKVKSKSKPPTKVSPLVNRTGKRLSASRKNDYYYDGDQLYHSDYGNDAAEDSYDSQPTTTALLKEIKTEPSDDEQYTSAQPKGPSCPICVNRYFRGINKLVRHMRSHTQEKPYTCPVCQVGFSQTYHLLRHMRRQHNAGEHVCSLCGITLVSAIELQEHKKLHPAEAVSCPLCTEVCSSSSAFASHIRAHCEKPPSKEELEQLPKKKKRGRPKKDVKQTDQVKIAPKLTSDVDMNAFVSQSGLQSVAASIGYNLAHLENPQNILDYISQQDDTGSPDKLTQKILSELRTEDSESDNDDVASLVQIDLKKPHCPHCHHKFNGFNKLLRHMQTHSQDKPYSCLLCAMTFSQGYHLVRHMRVQHDAGQFVCSKCGQDVQSMEELQAHRRTHPPEPVPCPYCEKIYPSYHKFLGHIRRHGKVSMLVEQGTLGKPLSDDSECDEGEEQDPLGNWELVGQDVCVGVGIGIVGDPTAMTNPLGQAEEVVPPPVQKRKRGRPRRQIIVTEQESVSQSEPSCSSEGPVTSNTVGEESSQMEEQREAGLPIESDSEYCPGSEENASESSMSNSESHKKSNQIKKIQEVDKTSKPKPKGHFCPICKDRSFRGANKLARHMRVHTKERPFKCPICHKAFSQNYHMARHQRVQHHQGRYTCTECGQKLGNWIEFKNHKSLHEPGVVCCPFCDKQFKHKSLYLAHIKVHKTGAPRVTGVLKSFACSDCGRVFKRRTHLRRHILGHRKATNGEYYTCSKCPQTFAFPEDLKRHMRKHEKEEQGICPLCSKSFASPEDLPTHMDEVHNWTCSICGKKFKLETALKKHEEAHANGLYYCAQCNKFFQKQSHYKRHMAVHKKRENRCPHCNTVFIKVNAFKYHLRTHVNERPYQCSCCLESFEHKEDYDYHCLRHKKFKKERPYSCTRCDWAFATLSELAEHMNEHEGEQPANCPICSRSFLNKNKLEKHMSIHTGERPHLCSICGNGFPSAASLKLHFNVHTGFKPFQCDQCPKSFSTSSSLKLHSRQHMAVRPKFECPECGRTYGRKTELKMHQRYHTGDKPHACSCCNKRFISRDKLNVHMRIHTGERPYSCPHCGQTFSQTGDRNRHIKKFH